MFENLLKDEEEEHLKAEYYVDRLNMFSDLDLFKQYLHEREKKERSEQDPMWIENEEPPDVPEGLVRAMRAAIERRQSDTDDDVRMPPPQVQMLAAEQGGVPEEVVDSDELIVE